MMFLFLIISLVWPATEAPNEILILPTLHKLHHDVSNYSFEVLAATLAALNPDILVVELTDADLRSRKKQRMKVEYNKVVFDFADSNDIPMVAMEPPEPKYSRLVSMMRENSKKIRAEQPQAVAAFDKFLGLFYARFSD